MKKKKKKKNQNGKVPVYNMPPNPDDPEFEKRRKKALESFRNRQGTKLEEEVLRGLLTDLTDQMESLQLEKMMRQQNVRRLEVQIQQQNCQYPAWDGGYP